MVDQIHANKLSLLLPIIFFVSTSMFVRSWIPVFHSSWPYLLAGCLLLVVVVPQYMRSKWCWLILFYAFIVSLNWFSGDQVFTSASVVVNEIMNLFLYGATTYYIFKARDSKCVYAIFYVMLLMLGIAAIGSLIVNQVAPSIVRLQVLYAYEGINEDDLFQYYRMGLTNYILPHGLPVIIPPLVLLIKRQIKNKLLFWSALLMLVFVLVLVYLGGSTTILLLSVFTLSSFFLKHDTSKNYMYFAAVAFLLVVFILFPNFINDIQMLLGSNETTATYSSHIDDLQDFTTSESQGNTATRLGLYAISLNEFFSNPIWGTNNPMSSHSVLFDQMGSLGLLGFIPLMGVLVCFYRFVRRYLDEGQRPYFIISFLSFFIVLLLKGIDAKEIWLMALCVAPCIYYLSSLQFDSQQAK